MSTVRHPTGKTAHTGVTDRPRVALKGRPQTAAQLAVKLGVNATQVRHMVNQLCDVTGGVVRVGKIGKEVIYALTSDVAKRPKPTANLAKEIRVAQPITIPQYKYFARGPW